ncbi:MAG: MipA/OmpV family protein [Sphingomonadales bacterium]|nr:MAG: MipA/OmpV family protein [Sphingomonadales bacterium]
MESSRRRKHVAAPIDEVGTTFEAGGFVQYWLGNSFRIRTEARKGIGGHRGLVGSVSADFVVRDGDKYVVSVGPRLSVSDRDYQNAYFGVTPGAAARTGLPVYRTGNGIHAVGVASGASYSLNDRWGLIGYVKYDRLVGDAGRSPLIRAYGKRDQLAGGLGLTYTFGRSVR